MLTFILDYTNQYIFNIISHLLEYQVEPESERWIWKMGMMDGCFFGLEKV